MTEAGALDLIVLVADGDMEEALRGLLGRPAALRIRPPKFEILRHPERDPGCFHQAPDFLRSKLGTFRRAFVLLDRDGSGQEGRSREQLEADLEGRLVQAGWTRQTAAAVVVDPELEAWIWSDSPHVADLLGWTRREPSLEVWMRERGYLADDLRKPNHPKEAVRDALRAARAPRSATLFRELASRVSFERCSDPAFLRLKEVLRGWFGAESL